MQPGCLLGLLGAGALLYHHLTWEGKALNRLAKRFGLDRDPRGISGRGFSLYIVTRKVGENSKEDWIVFNLDLPDSPPGVHIHREGADSGSKASQGKREHLTGDVDFDDLLWIEVAEAGELSKWLTAARRATLIRAFWAFPNLQFQDQRVWGEIKCSEANLSRVTHRLLAIHEPVLGKPLKPGWVNASQRRSHALNALLMAFPLMLPYAAMVYNSRDRFNQDWTWLITLPGMWPMQVLFVLGFLFLYCGFGLLLGNRYAAQRLRGMLRVAQICVAMVASMTLLFGLGALLASAVFAGILIYFWEQWRHSLLRLRLGPQEPTQR